MAITATTTLLYRPLSTRRCSYPKFIMLRNGATPIPIKRQHLGNDNCAALVASGHAVSVPPIINNIADFLYRLQELDSSIHLRCIYNIVAKNLMRVCIEDEDHIHPFQAHLRLAITSGSILINNHFRQTIIQSLPSVRGYLESQWGERISLIPFKDIIIDFYDNC